jgi:hypothetical protein
VTGLAAATQVPSQADREGAVDGDALSAGAHLSITEQTYGPVIAAITRLLEAGQRDGTIRQDADPGDFLQLTGALWRAASGPQDRSQAMLGLILDGLSANRQC